MTNKTENKETANVKDTAQNWWNEKRNELVIDCNCPYELDAFDMARKQHEKEMKEQEDKFELERKQIIDQWEEFTKIQKEDTTKQIFKETKMIDRHTFKLIINREITQACLMCGKSLRTEILDRKIMVHLCKECRIAFFNIISNRPK